MSYKEVKQVKPWFKFFASIILFSLGVVLAVKNFFFAATPNAYELVFSVQFITAGICLMDGKFHGIGKP